jgi:hypothetical protein
MTGAEYSEASFGEFMRQCVVLRLHNPATLRSRKLAAEQLLTELKSHERNDLRLVDVDELCSRFYKLQDSTIRPESLDVYKSRLQDAIADFIAWTNDQESFAPRESQFKATREMFKSESEEFQQAREELALNPPRSPLQIFPVPIREDLVVYIQNVPLNMTRKEADKIAAVVRALADSDSESDSNG